MSPAFSLSEESPRVGTPGTADRRAVINVADLARHEATRPDARKEWAYPPLIPIPHDLPVPEMTKGTEQPDVDARQGLLRFHFAPFPLFRFLWRLSLPLQTTAGPRRTQVVLWDPTMS